MLSDLEEVLGRVFLILLRLTLILVFLHVWQQISSSDSRVPLDLSFELMSMLQDLLVITSLYMIGDFLPIVAEELAAC